MNIKANLQLETCLLWNVSCWEQHQPKNALIVDSLGDLTSTGTCIMALLLHPAIPQMCHKAMI